MRARRSIAVILSAVLASVSVAEAGCPKAPFDFADWSKPKGLPIDVYFDGSQSMAGYAKAGADVPAIADLVQILADHRGLPRQPVRYFAFGSVVKPIIERRAASYADAVTYDCRSCDNQESRIDTTLRLADQSSGSVSLIVTDLWLDNTSFRGSVQVALGTPLRHIIAGGRAVAVIGIQSPFRGKVYDLPGVGSYQLSGERPLFILAIGPEADVAQVISALRESGSPAFSNGRMQVSLFSAGDETRQVRGPIPQGGGTQASAPLGVLRGIPHFSFDRALAARQRGSISGLFDVHAGIRQDAVWSGPLQARTKVWVWNEEALACPGNSFSPLSDLPSWSSKDGRSAFFSLDAKNSVRLRPGRTYLIRGELGTKTLRSPNIDNDWLRDLSLTRSGMAAFVATHPTTFKVLNLADLVGLMERGVITATPTGRMTIGFKFLVTIL